jgi:hypothetical protein
LMKCSTHSPGRRRLSRRLSATTAAESAPSPTAAVALPEQDHELHHGLCAGARTRS